MKSTPTVESLLLENTKEQYLRTTNCSVIRFYFHSCKLYQSIHELLASLYSVQISILIVQDINKTFFVSTYACITMKIISLYLLLKKIERMEHV